MLIPDVIRSERILTPADPIRNAVANKYNSHMLLLYTVWYEYVEPNGKGDIDCGICLGRVLKNYRAMRAELEQLEAENNLINAVRNGR